LRPRPNAFAVLEPSSPIVAGEKTRAVPSIIDQHSVTGNAGTFIALENGNFTHIVPSTRLDESGVRVPYRSLLSEHITFAAQDLTVGQIVEAVLQQVSTIRRVNVKLGSVLISLFLTEHQTRGASDEAAEDVLVKTFELASHIGQAAGAHPRPMTWDLLYDPDGNQLFFNVHIVANTIKSKTTSTSRITGPK
jgi:hypothetical protein